MGFNNKYHWLLLILPLLFLALFYFYPLLRIFHLSFFSEGTWQGKGIISLFTTTTYYNILKFTFFQATISTLLTLLVALPGAWIYGQYNFPGKTLFRTITTIPFVLPTVVVAAAFHALLGESGLINTMLMETLNLTAPPIRIEQTIYFFLLAHVFYNYSIVVRIVGGYWEAVDPKLRQAAATLGASPLKVFFHVSLPLLMPAIASAALLIFIFCFTSFGVILILGGPLYATLEVEIYRQTISLFNLPMAATLSLVQIICNFFLMWLLGRLATSHSFSWFGESTQKQQGKDSGTGKMVKIFIILNMIFVTLLILLPMLGLLVHSLRGEDGWTISYYQALFVNKEDSLFFVSPFMAITNSISFGVATMLIGLAVGLPAALFLARAGKKGTGLMDAVIMLPLATSAVTLGLGYIISFNKPPLNIRGSVFIVIFAHTLAAFPFIIRCLLPSLRAVPLRLKEAAAMLGASPIAVILKIEFPLIKKALLAAAIFAFAISMGELGASIFVTRPDTPTLPVAIFQYLSRPGELNYGQAMAMSVILMLATMVAFFIMEKLTRSGER
jgi:thiamine transport system permease protein